MMKPYPNMKNSCVEWIGKIPEHWDVIRMRYLINIETGSKDTQDQNPLGSFPFFVRSDTIEKIDSFSFDREAILTAGDGVGVCKVFHYYEGKFEAHQRVYVLSNFKDILGKYLFYYIKENFIKEVLRYSAKSTVDSLRRYMFENFPVALPSLPDQTRIVAFLDDKTSKIDELIAKKERKIELLKEQRKALINQAVTKGLDPTVPMKDTGVEWIGEIPEHWEVKKTKYIFDLVTDKAPENNQYELLSIYTDIGVEPRKNLEAKGNKATTTDGYWIVRKEDIIVNKLLAWMGAIGVSKYDGVTSPAYDILRPKKDTQSTFYHYLFRSKMCQVQLKRYSYGIMNMRLRLYFSQFGQIFMPVPPYDEQGQIIAYMKEKDDEISKSIDLESQKIELLKECRQALISEVVTGKVDVRDWEPTPKEVAA